VGKDKAGSLVGCKEKEAGKSFCYMGARCRHMVAKKEALSGVYDPKHGGINLFSTMGPLPVLLDIRGGRRGSTPTNLAGAGSFSGI